MKDFKVSEIAEILLNNNTETIEYKSIYKLEEKKHANNYSNY